MLKLVIFIASQLSPTPTSEAEDLGRKLASLSGIAVIAPKMVEKDLQDLRNEDTTLSEAERTRLLAIGHAEADRGLDRLIAALGHAYASRLSLVELRRLVTDAEAPAAVHRRAIEPDAIMETMAKLGEMDLKKNVSSAFCRETGKLCHR